MKIMITQIFRKKVTQLIIVAMVILLVSLSGCARFSTYLVDRTDQNLEAGNRGTIYGSGPPEPLERKKKKSMINIEFELPPFPEWRKYYWTDKEVQGNKGYILKGPSEHIVGPTPTKDEVFSIEEGISETAVVKDKVSPEKAKGKISEIAAEKGKLPTTYTVQKGETLRDIAGYSEIYGNPLEWPRIYQANRESIKDPDFIYPGQVLRIPREPTDKRWIK
jgi:uncharacterized protein YpmB